MRRRFRYVKIEGDGQGGERFRNVRRRPRAQAAATNVYIFKRADGLIKVGVTKNVERRLSSLRQASPDHIEAVRVLSAEPGMAWAIEAGFKALMRPLHRRGEWFDCSERLAIVALHVAEHGDLTGCAFVRAEIELRKIDYSQRDWETCRAHTRAFNSYVDGLLQSFPAIRDRASPFTFEPTARDGNIMDQPDDAVHARSRGLDERQVRRALEAARIAERRALAKPSA